MNAEFPEILEFLFEPHRYKVLYGGRGGTKSWGFGRTALIEGTRRPLRVVCARETMKSIGDSVHQLLEDQIHAIGLQETGSAAVRYRVGKTSIEGTNGTEFSFHGLKHNINNIKSLESADVLWVEEAANVSKDSWSKVIPTMRKKGSEIWVGFNPELESDDTYQRFVVHPPPEAKVVKIGWQDNPWFHETTLPAERAHLLATDPEEEHHVYGGFPRKTLEGAIYAKELRAAETEQRITKVPYDPTKPVHTAWDLGEGDATAIWFFQTYMAEYRFIDYLEDSGQKMAHYLELLQGRRYVYGMDYLPWDACSGMLSGTLEQAMRAAGRNIRILPKHLSVDIGIDQARTIFANCWFDADKCADGINCLRYYQYGPVKDLGTQTRKPLHNWASHGADAFRSASNGITLPKREVKAPPPASSNRRAYEPTAWS
jgi:phage terminase large subunit